MRNNRWHRRRVDQLFFVLLLSLVMSSSVSIADGFRNPPESAAALGRGSGKFVLTDDASATSINPANLTRVSTPNAMFSLTMLHAETDYDGVSGSGSTEEPWKTLPNAFMAWPIPESDWTLGFAVTTPFGQSTEWDRNGPFRYTAPYFAELRTLDFQPAAAIKVIDCVSIGIGADLLWSDLDFRQDYPWAAATGNPLAPDGTAEFEADGYGVGAHAGITWDMTSHHHLALTYRTPIQVDYDGDLNISSMPNPALFPPPLQGSTPRSDFATDIEFPATWGIGYGFDITDRIRIGVDLERIEFSSYDTLPLDAANNQLLLPAPEIRQDWEDTWSYGLGVDWRFTENFTIRGGYVFLESPIPDSTLAPTLPDADRHVFSAGVGYHKGAHVIDAAVVLSHFEDRDISNNQNPAYNGTYESEASILAISYGYAF